MANTQRSPADQQKIGRTQARCPPNFRIKAGPDGSDGHIKNAVYLHGYGEVTISLCGQRQIPLSLAVASAG